MDETTTVSTGEDISLPEDWSGVDTAEFFAEDETLGEADTTSEDTDEADQPAATEEDAPAAPAEPESPPAEETPADQFTLKHLDEVKTVSREEVTALAQKGLDYDRVRAKHDALVSEKTQLESRLKEVSEGGEFMTALAKERGMSVTELIDSTRAQQIAARDGIDEAVALRQVKQDRRDAELAEREKNLSSAKPVTPDADAEKKAHDERVTREVSEFLAAKPDTALKDIPEAVLVKWRSGTSLLAAYLAHENEALAREKEALAKSLETEKKNKANKAKSTGSLDSAGAAPTEKDPWLADLQSRK